MADSKLHWENIYKTNSSKDVSWYKPCLEKSLELILALGLPKDAEIIDVGGYVEEAKKIVAKELKLPPGYSLLWSRQYENMMRVRERLKVILPLTIFTICLLLYMNTISVVKAGIVMLAVPFSLIGAVWLLWALAPT